jgi:hypothetical protein
MQRHLQISWDSRRATVTWITLSKKSHKNARLRRSFAFFSYICESKWIFTFVRFFFASNLQYPEL